MIRLVDNKRLDMTNEEHDLYEKICNSYPKGKDLFRGLFETDSDGVIIFLIPPEREFSMEVVMFLQNLMLQQHLRRIYNEHNAALVELKSLKKTIEAALPKS
jgi:hypothetical protein